MNKYAQLTNDELESHLSNYLIDSWSYSKVSCFARNEKDFERSYIYMEPSHRSISSIAGNAYHEALKVYFMSLMITDSSIMAPDLTELTDIAYTYLDDEVPDNSWRLTDKFPTVEQARQEATRLVTALLENFCREYTLYTDNIAQVLSVEQKSNAWVTVNGVDIPLPLHFITDLVVRTRDGKTVIIDHKSKGSYTSEDELTLVHGQQAMTYVIGCEQMEGSDMHIDEVWFIENKYSRNKDKSAQLRLHAFQMDSDSRLLHGYYLYQPLRSMLQAVSDPDHIYLVNPADNMADKAELYEFASRTLIAEVDDFQNIPESKKPLIAQRLRKIKDSSMAMISPRVITAFRKNAASFIAFDYSHSNMTNPQKIEHAFRTFGKQVQVAHEIEGYSCNTYLCEVAAGVQLGTLSSYSKDIAYALDVPSVRIASNLVVYGGKSYLSIEVSRQRTETVEWQKDLLEGHAIPVGMDNFRNPVIWDLDNHSTPHMLVCGATGSGKSVMIRSTIEYALAAGVASIVVFDPKYEFVQYRGGRVEVWNEIEDIESKMKSLVDNMQAMVRQGVSRLTLVIFDEFADAVQQARSGSALDRYKEVTEMTTRGLKVRVIKDGRDKSLSENLQMLLQKGRSSGFRVLAATQRADTKVINGSTKVNFPVLCCFRVPKALDSKVVIDEEGANSLAGNGDGLLKSPQYNDQLIRFQGFYKG